MTNKASLLFYIHDALDSRDVACVKYAALLHQMVTDIPGPSTTPLSAEPLPSDSEGVESRVRALHRRIEYADGTSRCYECISPIFTEAEEWPCRTIQALDTPAT